MTLRSRFLATSTAGLILATSSFAFAQTRTTTAVKTGYAPVNGLNLYYEIHSAGEPLILLHGGVVGITMFGPNLAALSEKRQVIAVELQGHGHTADIDRPLSFEALADDIAALMKYLGIQQADIMGYSLGGAVALQTAIRHPQSVRKLVVVSAPFKRDGFYPEVLAAMAQMGPGAAAGMKQSPLSQLYPNVNWSCYSPSWAISSGRTTTGRRKFRRSKPHRCSYSPTPMLSAPRTSWSFSDCSVAARKTPVWMVLEGPWPNSPSCPVSRITTFAPPPRSQRLSPRFSMRLCRDPSGMFSVSQNAESAGCEKDFKLLTSN